MKRLLLFAVVATLFAACTQDIVVDVTNPTIDDNTPETLVVGFEDDETRIQLNEAQKTVWTKGDQVSVFYFSDANQLWQYNGETGSRTANLKRVNAGEPTAQTTYNVVAYPFNEDYFLNTRTGALHATLPVTQHYLQDSYGVGDNLMVAQSEFTQFSLKNVCGWLKLQLTGDGEVVKSITFKGNDGEQVAGLIHVDTATAEATLASEMGSTEDNNAGGNLVFDDTILTAVTLDCGEGVTLGKESTAFYIALPPQTFEEGFTVEVKCIGYKTMTISTDNSISLERNHIQPMAALEFINTNPPTQPTPASNEIWYTSSDGDVVMPYNTNAFGANIISNEYNNGMGVITFDGDVTTIEECAFSFCYSLTSVTIPDSVTTIGSSAFHECTSLTSVNIGDSVTTIGDCAFFYCVSLTSVNIPESVTTIGNAAFAICKSLREFTGKYAADGGRCLIIDNTIIAYAEASGTTYNIPDSVTTIGNDAFAYCDSLTSVNIGDSVTTIGYYAFYDCYSLTSVTIPDSVTNILYAAFSACYNLVKVCCQSTTPPSVEYWAFGMNDELQIYVPGESVNDYQSAEGWNQYASCIVSALELSVDKDRFAADGSDYVTLIVEYYGDVINEGIEFYTIDNERVDIENLCFKTDKAGSYSIYAKYNETISNNVYILAMDENTPEFISITGETGTEDIECAILGLDGSVMYYHQNASNPGVVYKISRYNNITKEVEFIINLDEDGMVRNIITPEITVVLGNYHDNLVDAMFFTADGERVIIKDIEYDNYSNMITRSPSGIEITNLAVSGLATGLEIAAITAGSVAAGPLSIALLTINVGLLAYDAATAFDLIDGNMGADFGTYLLGHYGHLAGLATNFPSNRLEAIATLAATAAELTGLAELVEGDAEHKIVIGDANLNPNESISATLTWSGSADIDLHCEGPSGHICYYNMSCPGGYLDNDNTTARGPETIYYSNPMDGQYSFYIHYYAENNGVKSVDYTVIVNSFGQKEEFSGTISGAGSVVPIKTILIGGITTRNSSSYKNYVIDWNNLPQKIQ